MATDHLPDEPTCNTRPQCEEPTMICDNCGVDAPDDESCGDPCCGRCSHPPRGGRPEASAREAGYTRLRARLAYPAGGR
jgi:hypothetical protein